MAKTIDNIAQGAEGMQDIDKDYIWSYSKTIAGYFLQAAGAVGVLLATNEVAEGREVHPANILIPAGIYFAGRSICRREAEFRENLGKSPRDNS